MATIGFTIPTGIFPAGASVSAYPASAWPGSQWPPVDTPTGSATQTKTAAGDGTVVFDALTEQTRYVAWDGTHATRFSTGAANTGGPITTSSTVPTALQFGEVRLVLDVQGNVIAAYTGASS